MGNEQKEKKLEKKRYETEIRKGKRKREMY